MHAQVGLQLLRIYQHTKFEMPSFTDFKDMIGQNLKNGHVIITTPNRGQCVILRLALDIFYPHTKFGDTRFSRSRYMIGGVENTGMENAGVEDAEEDKKCVSGKSRSRSHRWKMQEWKIQER